MNIEEARIESESAEALRVIGERHRDSQVHTLVRGNALERSVTSLPGISAPKPRTARYERDDAAFLKSDAAWKKIDVKYDPKAGEALTIDVQHLGEVAAAQGASVENVAA